LNHYNVLGVNSNASAKEIKTAFYRLSIKYHPDVNPDDKNAASKFNIISNAYEILNDPIKRREYDYELLSKKPISDPYVTYGGYAQRARASAWQSPYEQYDTAFGRYRDSKNEDHFEEKENEGQKKSTSTIVSKFILFSLCLSYGLVAFFTSNLFYAMHFQQQTEEYPSRRLTFSKLSR
jgi:curved DNA-binding protein CbpA